MEDYEEDEERMDGDSSEDEETVSFDEEEEDEDPKGKAFLRGVEEAEQIAEEKESTEDV